MSDSTVSPTVPLRVTYVIPGLGTGGAEHSLAELLGHGFGGAVTADVVCLHRRGEGVQERVIEGLGATVTWLPDGGRLGSVVRARALRHHLANNRTDLVVSSVYEADILARMALIGRRTPRLISTLVNSQYTPERVAADPNVSRWGMLATQVVDAVTGRIVTDHYIALTQAVADHAAQRLKVRPDRITVVPRGRSRARMGMPSAERRAEARERLGIEGDRPVLLSVGRCEYQKGQRYLLEALPMVLESNPDVLLLIAGRVGNATADLERLTDSLGLSESVRFLGHEGDVSALLAGADIFVFPSLWEGFGGALIEALAMQLPVVVSDLPELREVLGDLDPPTGVRVPPADPGALGAALVKLLADPERRDALGAAGRQRFDDCYELDRVAEATLAVYRAAVAA